MAFSFTNALEMKRYLTGIDWVINSLDFTGKINSGIGNISCVVIELEGQPDSKALEWALSGFLLKFPLLSGRPRRGLNLCPYWKVYPGTVPGFFRLDVLHLENNLDPLPWLEAQINKPFTGTREHLAFTLIYAGSRSFLEMVFDHRILDARGAEALLGLFQRYYLKESIPEVEVSEPAHLDRWKDKFTAGRVANRFFLNLAKSSPRALRAFPQTRVCKVRMIHFDAEKTKRFGESAYAKAGYLMRMPYALARCVQIMHRIFKRRGVSGSSYLIPVSIDSRAQELVTRQVFFNHISFFIFNIDAKSAGDFSVILARLKEQMYEQVKSGVPEAIRKASFLLRIVPLPMVNFIIQRMLKKQFASFSFSFVDTAYNADTFMATKVRDIFHLPRVPNPPGVGIFFTQTKETINATVSYFEGILDECEADEIAAAIESIAD